MPALKPASSNYSNINIEDLDKLLNKLLDLSTINLGLGCAS
jgi:hypothetical protein